MNLNLKLLRADAKVPAYGTDGAAAMDLSACLTEPLTLNHGDLAMVPTGIAISLPSGDYMALVFARSGLGVKHGISLSNGVGVIDSDYRGEISVGLTNLSQNPYTIQNGDRIAQLAVVPVAHPGLTVVSQLDDTARSDGGFGSTGT